MTALKICQLNHSSKKHGTEITLRSLHTTHNTSMGSVLTYSLVHSACEKHNGQSKETQVTRKEIREKCFWINNDCRKVSW